MKIKIIALVITAVSFSANAMDVSQAQEAVAHAQRMADAAQGSVDAAQSTYGQGTVQGWADTANRAGAFRAQAMSDLNAANQNLSHAISADKKAKEISNYGIKTNSAGNPVTMVAGTKQNPTGNSTINVAASTLSPSTMVKTDKGIVTAGSLPKNTQVAVAYNSAFSSPVRGGNVHPTSHSAGEHGTGNGANNAANSHSAHGLGGSESIGGGHSGGGYHY